MDTLSDKTHSSSSKSDNVEEDEEIEAEVRNYE